MTSPSVIMVGAGVAGLSTALNIHPSIHVTVLSKGALTDGATPLAQGGIAMSIASLPDKSPDMRAVKRLAYSCLLVNCH